jgi:hypothetical protein
MADCEIFEIYPAGISRDFIEKQDVCRCVARLASLGRILLKELRGIFLAGIVPVGMPGFHAVATRHKSG